MIKINSLPVVVAILVLITGCSTPVPTAAPPSTKTPTAADTPTLATPKPNVSGVTPSATGPTPGPRTFPAPPAMTVDVTKSYTATIRTSAGDMVADLFVEDAPITVNNFVFLSRLGFYNTVIFHRIIKGFMIQTGDPLGNGTGGPGYSFEDEPTTRKYLRGTLAMANSGPNTNGSQFFVVHQDTPLPSNYTIFGIVTGAEGLEVLDKLADTPVASGGEGSSPTQKVSILSVDIQEQ